MPVNGFLVSGWRQFVVTDDVGVTLAGIDTGQLRCQGGHTGSCEGRNSGVIRTRVQLLGLRKFIIFTSYSCMSFHSCSTELRGSCPIFLDPDGLSECPCGPILYLSVSLHASLLNVGTRLLEFDGFRRVLQVTADNDVLTIKIQQESKKDDEKEEKVSNISCSKCTFECTINEASCLGAKLDSDPCLMKSRMSQTPCKFVAALKHICTQFRDCT